MNIRYIIILQEISAKTSKMAREAYQGFINQKYDINYVINLQRQANITAQKARDVYSDYFKYIKYKKKYLQLKIQSV
jgi:hypothetical protein